MEIRQLQAFKTVAQVKNFTQAAELLGYAQSSISSQIRSLEDELGVKLFERLGKTVSLTQDGERLLVYAEKLLQIAKEAKEAFSTTHKGTLTIGAPESLCTFLLPPLLQEYNRRYPEVELVLKIFGGTDIGHLARLLKENTIDVCFIMDNKTNKPELCSKVISSEAMSLFTGINHPLAARDYIEPSDLNHQVLILTEKGCYYRAYFENILAEANVQPSSVLWFESIETIKQCVANGLGIAFLPRMTIKKELAQGQLAELNWVGTHFDVMSQMVYHEDKWISPALSCLLELAKEML